MLIKFGRILREKEDPENKGGSGNSSRDPEAIEAENKALKERLSAIEPKISALEAQEAKRLEAQKKAEEDKRKKELGVEKVLEEKDAALKTASERLEAYEKREMARIDSVYSELPENVRQAIDPLKEKLDLTDWAELVEKQRGLLAEIKQEDNNVPSFLKPKSGGSPSEKNKTSPKARELIDIIGKGDTMIDKVESKAEYDKESGARVVKFTRQTRQFYKDMKVPQVFRLGVKQ